MRGRKNSPLLFPALGVAMATGFAFVEWLFVRTSVGVLPLWSLWSAILLSMAFAVMALGLWRRSILEEFLWIALLWPAACIVFHQIAHERAWPHLALGVGGLQHWSRVWILMAFALLPVALGLGRVHRALARRFSGAGQVAASILATALVALASWNNFAPSAEAERSPPDPDWPNILLLSIDTLRQDALSPYGGPPSALDPWIAQAEALDGWAPSPWTLPSLHALMRGSSSSGAGGEPRRPVPPDDPWWPQTLQAAGYRTEALLTNIHLVQEFAFDRGFDHYDHSDRIELLRSVDGALFARFVTRQWSERRQLERGDHRADAALRRLGEMPSDRPWFLWLHMIDPHLPYYLRGENGAVHAQERPKWLESLGAAFENEKFFDLPGMREGAWPSDGPFLDALRRLYAREVDFAAHHAARVLQGAQEASADRPWIWILTSDHGEEFFEHGGFEHGHALTPELLRVPLIVGGSDPDQLPRRMRLQDLGPWLLSQLGLPALAAPGRELEDELARAVIGSDVPPEGCAPALLATHMLYGAPQSRWIRPDGRSSLWDEEGRLWRNDLCGDPLDLARQPALADSLEEHFWAQLQRWREDERLQAPVELDSQMIERLRALGYTQ